MNGNTLITEGTSGRLFEVTKEGKIVWEYIYPDFGGTPPSNNVYRACTPYDWIPQLEKPKEQPVFPPGPRQLQSAPLIREACSTPGANWWEASNYDSRVNHYASEENPSEFLAVIDKFLRGK